MLIWSVLHDARNPQFPNEEKLWRYRNYAGVVDENRRTFETSTELTGEAVLNEESFMDGMCLGPQACFVWFHGLGEM